MNQLFRITNEARFGKTIAPYQLASISVFRARLTFRIVDWSYL